MPLFKFFKTLDSDQLLSFRKKQEFPIPSITGEDQPENPYTEIQILPDHTDIVRHLLLIDESRFVSAGDDTTAIIWDYEYGKILHVLRGHVRPIACMLLHEPSYGLFEQKTLLLTGSSDQSLQVWDVNNGRCLRVLKNHDSTLRWLVHVEDKQFVCGAGQKLIVWGPNLNFVCAHEFVYQEDITQLICLNHQLLVGCMNKQLAVFTFSTVAGTIRGIKFICKLKSHREAVRSLVVVSDTLFASGSLDGEVIVWSTNDWLPMLRLTSHKQYTSDRAVYPYSVQSMLLLSSIYFAAAVGNGFCVYNSMTGNLLFAHLHAHNTKVQQLELVNSGLLLATCSEDGSIKFWRFPHICEKQGCDSKISPEKENVALLHALQMRDKMRSQLDSSAVEKPELVGECIGHTGPIIRMISLGAAGFASCGMDQLIILWKDGDYQSQWRTRHLNSITNKRM